MLRLTALTFATAVISMPAQAAPTTEPRPCAYADERLARECRADPELQAYLQSPEGKRVQGWYDLPPVIRGWDPGEEEKIIRFSRAQAASDEALRRETEPVLRQRIVLASLGAEEKLGFVETVDRVIKRVRGPNSRVLNVTAMALDGKHIRFCGSALYGDGEVGSFIMDTAQGAVNVAPERDDLTFRCSDFDVRLR